MFKLIVFFFLNTLEENSPHIVHVRAKSNLKFFRTQPLPHHFYRLYGSDLTYR